MFTRSFPHLCTRAGWTSSSTAILTAIVVVLALTGCTSERSSSESDTQVTPPQSDSSDLPQGRGEVAYDYTATTEGLEVVKGTLFLDFGERGQDLRTMGAITGHWELEIILQLPDLGEQHGTGALEAGFDAQDVLTVALNPGWADNNVELRGTFDESGVLSGSWFHTKFTGLARTGEFVARPK